MTNKELGAKIRADIKAAGIPARAVSVRVSDAGYETAVRVSIKDINVDRNVVERIAMRYREVDRDERSGEILAGGNTFVFVDYDYDVIRSAAAQYMDQAQEIIDSNNQPCVGVDIATRDDGSRLVYFFEAPNSTHNMAVIYDKNGHYDYSKDRYVAHNACHLAQALALYNAVGHF